MTKEETLNWLYNTANELEITAFVYHHQIYRHLDDLDGINSDIEMANLNPCRFNNTVADIWEKEAKRHIGAIGSALNAIKTAEGCGAKLPTGLDYSVRFEIQEA